MRSVPYEVPTDIEVPVKTSEKGRIRWVTITVGGPEGGMRVLRRVPEFEWQGSRSSGIPLLPDLADDPDYEQAVSELGTVPVVHTELERRGGKLRAANEAHVAHQWLSFAYDLEHVVQRLSTSRAYPAAARRLEDAYYRDQWDWALVHGSERLKKGLLSGHKMNGLYRRERGEATFPNCYIEADHGIHFRERPNPSEQALSLRDELVQHADEYEALEVDPVVCWVTGVPDEILTAWRLTGVDVDLAEGGLEAVRVDGWLGRHRVWAFVPRLPLNRRTPFTGERGGTSAARAEIDDQMRAIQFASAYGVTELDQQRALQAGTILVTEALTNLPTVMQTLEEDHPHPGLEALLLALPPAYADSYTPEFFSRLAACAGVVGFKLAQATPAPFTNVAEHLVLLAICEAGEAFFLAATGKAEDMHWFFSGLDSLQFPDTGPDLDADPNLSIDRWFEPFSNRVGETHPLLTWEFEAVNPWEPTLIDPDPHRPDRARSDLLDRARVLYEQVRESPLEIDHASFKARGMLVEPDDIEAESLEQLGQVLLRVARDYGERCYVHGMIRTGDRSAQYAGDEEPDCLMLDIRPGDIS